MHVDDEYVVKKDIGVCTVKLNVDETTLSFRIFVFPVTHASLSFEYSCKSKSPGVHPKYNTYYV